MLIVVTTIKADSAEIFVCWFSSGFWKLSLGDARSYILTTAKNELGVVSATSVSGEPITRFSILSLEHGFV
jgi:hypothetical protein